MKINDVLKKELDIISLSETQINGLKEQAKEIIRQIPNSFIGGSLAKETLINKKIQDIDIFVVFNNEEDTGKLPLILNKAGIHGKVVHGSRDYVQILGKNVIFEIIPVVKINKLEDVKNVTDFSLSHVNYVLKQIKKNKKLADEIKLAKAFCYAQNVYGAESYIKGFSGYALELLVIYFKSFIGFLKQINKKKVIDIEKLFKNENQIKQELNESKLLSPIILIDPTYKNRNACAGLSKESFDKFLIAGKSFLKNPSLDFFERKIINTVDLEKIVKKKKARLLEINLKTDKQEGDIAATKMKKFFDFIIHELENKEQKVIVNEFEYNDKQEAKAYLIVKEIKEIEVKGPPKNNKIAVKNFKKTRKKIYFKKDFAYAKEKISLKDIFAHIKRFEEEMGVSFEVN